MLVKFCYPIYNPCYRVLDVARDWNIDLACVTTDLELVRRQPFRIAALRVFYNQPTIHGYESELSDLDASQFDFVILSDAEYHQPKDVLSWINSSGIENYVLATSGQFHNFVFTDRIIYRNFWLPRFLEVNTYQETFADIKPYLFDALLGARRPNRDFFMLAAEHHELLNLGISTYRLGFPGGFVDNYTDAVVNAYPNTKLHYPYVSPNLDPLWEPCQEITNTISFYTPFNIYRNTWYSVLCETISYGRDFFLSEKTMKAFYAQRLFVHIGAQYFLQRLHNLGFETFGDIIDEGYDRESNAVRRYQRAFDQIIALSKENHSNLYYKLRPRLEHNHHWLVVQKERSLQSMSELLRQYLSKFILD